MCGCDNSLADRTSYSVLDSATVCAMTYDYDGSGARSFTVHKRRDRSPIDRIPDTALFSSTT
jgi:hypothetical protein